MVKPWFSYDHEGDGIVFHETAEAARKAAENSLDNCRDEAGSDGWPEGVSWIGWGAVHEWVQQTERKPWREYLIEDRGYDPEEADESCGDFEEYANYELVKPESVCAESEEAPQ